MNIIELAKKAGLCTNLAEMGASSIVYTLGVDGVTVAEMERFADLLLQKAMDELKTQADYSGSNRRAFYMDAIEVLRKFKESV